MVKHKPVEDSYCSFCGAKLGKEPHTEECSKLFFKKMEELDELWKKENNI